ncbi:MAG: hypothetical protein F8N36_13925 [Desulfovibrio sp.]|uniref:hypothetical protein n=1 Tax=Desulfovibrio sp. TaxID=885 RepID=UPI00135DBC4D|nr:hypothetical protein [Desulfovibrio sp.]MTJ93937.1 hypothetical protein [Desulfovibrio sp.]
MTQTDTTLVTAIELKNQVYTISLRINEADFKFLVAVRHDDIRTFIVLADVPDGGGLKVSMVRGELIAHVMDRPLVDWATAKISWGETSWLTRRENLEWRNIRRLEIEEDGTVVNKDWFPPGVAEPLLRALEDSVPMPAHLSTEAIGF